MFVKPAFSFVALFVLCTPVAAAHPAVANLPRDQRPEWLRREGLVMAGSWEPLIFRVRRGSDSYTPTPQQRADYCRQHGYLSFCVWFICHVKYH